MSLPLKQVRRMLQEALRYGIIKLVLLTVLYLIKYFQGVQFVDCQTNPRLTGNQCPRIAIGREKALIPKNKTDFNSRNVYDCSCLVSVYLNIIITTKRRAYSTCKKNPRYLNPQITNANGDPVKLAVRLKWRRPIVIGRFGSVSEVGSFCSVRL